MCQDLNATREGHQNDWRSNHLSGVKIGSRFVLGSGSVATRDIPEGMFAFGNPCRVIRKLTA